MSLFPCQFLVECQVLCLGAGYCHISINILELCTGFMTLENVSILLVLAFKTWQTGPKLQQSREYIFPHCGGVLFPGLVGGEGSLSAPQGCQCCTSAPLGAPACTGVLHERAGQCSAQHSVHPPQTPAVSTSLPCSCQVNSRHLGLMQRLCWAGSPFLSPIKAVSGAARGFLSPSPVSGVLKTAVGCILSRFSWVVGAGGPLVTPLS
jgi:hypothetical protein